jgi:hypothetical protein
VLRDYHSKIIDDFDRLLARGVWSLLVTAPTGRITTIIASECVPSAVAARQRLYCWLTAARSSTGRSVTCANRQGEEMAACHGGFGWHSLRGCGDE